MFLAQQNVQRAQKAPIPTQSLKATPVVTHVAWQARSIPLKKGSIRGFHPGFPGCSAIQFESLLECNVIGRLLAYPELVSLQSQPFTVHFDIGGTKHRYTPDLLVELRQVPADLARLGFERLTVVECKPSERVDECAEMLARARAAIGEIMSAPLVIVTDGSLATHAWEVTHAH